jgi:hypothetical protein
VSVVEPSYSVATLLNCVPLDGSEPDAKMETRSSEQPENLQRFFRAYKQNFGGLSGARFYKNVRNGLLHQGQTKAGWTLWKLKKRNLAKDSEDKVSIPMHPTVRSFQLLDVA